MQLLPLSIIEHYFENSCALSLKSLWICYHGILHGGLHGIFLLFLFIFLLYKFFDFIVDPWKILVIKADSLVENVITQNIRYSSYHFINIFTCRGSFPIKVRWVLQYQYGMLIKPYGHFIGWRIMYFEIESCVNYLMMTYCVKRCMYIQLRDQLRLWRKN